MVETKRWWESKAVWGGVLVFAGGGLEAVGLGEYGAPLIALGVALGFIGIRLGTKVIN